jgi:uncharacterized protein DUF3253
MSSRHGERAPGSRSEHELEEAILTLLSRRDLAASICPSEVARAVGGPNWRDLMESVREAARRLMRAGQVEITQGGEVVDTNSVTGPIRIRRAQSQRAVPSE